MQDKFGREINYLRLAVTDRCNLRCRYCLPAEGVPLKRHTEILTFEEIAFLITCAVSVGFKRVRLTGGEPLVRRGITRLVALLAQIPGLEEISLTTNGTRLASFAEELKKAGLARVNLSLDTLQADKFAWLTRGGKLEDVLAGIKAALEVGLTPVKLNVVLLQSFNEDELFDFVQLAAWGPLHVRFIELIPLGQLETMGSKNAFFPVAEAKKLLAHRLPLSPVELKGSGPAETYTFPGAKGSIGFIAAATRHFCTKCNRLRLTADGFLRPCLYHPLEIDLKSSLRQGKGREAIQACFQQAVISKPEGGRNAGRQERFMSQIGG